MPLFMDRHYTKDATRKAIEVAHENDLRVQGRHGVRFVTYWFDEARNTTFCLVEAPDEDAVRAVHAEAHGDLPHEIISVNADAVQMFLGRLTDPVPDPGHEEEAAPVDSGFRVIMFTDLKDSTALTAELGEDESMHLLRTHNALTRNALRAHDGREVKHTGDGFMASFHAAEDALACAVAIQRAFAGHRESHPDDPLRVRIGLGCGEPVEEDDDLFGVAVQTAARVCADCDPDRIVVADAVRQACSDTARWQFGTPKARSFKGFAQPVTTRELRWQ